MARNETYEIGDKIRVKFTGTIEERRSRLITGEDENGVPDEITGYSVIRVRQDAGYADGYTWTHFLFPDGGSVKALKGQSGGDPVEVDFTATIVGTVTGDPINTTRVSDDLGYTHFLFLESNYVTKVEAEAEPNTGGNNVPYNSDYKVGDNIRVNMNANIAGKAGEDKYGTTAVSDGGFTHYVYLSSKLVRTTGSRLLGDGLGAQFDAKIIGDVGGEKFSTTLVRELRPEGFTHFLYLGSDAIRKIEPEPEPKPVSYPVGTRLRVEMAGAVVDGSLGANATVRMVDVDNYEHRLYAGSSRVSGVNTYDAPAGRAFTASFEAKTIGDSFGESGGLKAVTEIEEDDSVSYTHYLNLNSPSVVVLAAQPVKVGIVPDASAAIAEAAVKAEARRVRARLRELNNIGTDKIEITSGQVLARIAELQDTESMEDDGLPRFALRRLTARAGQELELGRFETPDQAVNFIEFNDYDASRLRIDDDRAASSLTDEEQGELDLLRDLSDSGRATFGSFEWNGGTVILFRESYFDETWAIGQAQDEFRDADMNEWPFDQVDWDEAAEDRRDSDYTAVYFGDERYYGANQ